MVSPSAIVTTNQKEKTMRTTRLTLALVIGVASVVFITMPSQRWLPRGLSHIDDGAPSFKANFIHQGFHQVDSTTMTGLNVFRGGRIRDPVNLKSLSLVPDDKRDFVSSTATANVNLLPGVLMVAVNDGIRQGLE